MELLDEEKYILAVCKSIENGKSSKEDLKRKLETIPNRDRLQWRYNSPLISAVKRGNKKLIQLMINVLNFDLNATTEDWSNGNWCALATAVHAGNIPIAKWLAIKPKLNLEHVKNKILKDAICFGDCESVKFLLHEIRAGVNSKMFYEENPEKTFLPIHFAICKDFSNDDSSFKMTKFICESGGDLTFETWWSADISGFVVGQGETRGSVHQLILAMRKAPNLGRRKMKIEHFDNLLIFLYNKDYFPLIDHLTKSFNEVLATQLMQDMSINVNQVNEKIWNETADGPLLISALQHMNLKMVKILINDFRADVNIEIKLEGKQSTLLIFALRCVAGKKHTKSLEFLIESGAKTSTKGWIQIQKEWLFGSPLELANQMLKENEAETWKKSMQNIINFLRQGEEDDRLKMLSKAEFESEVHLNLKAFEEYRSKMLTHHKIMQNKIVKATKLLEQIKSIENNPEYLDEVGIEKECEKTSEMMRSALKVEELESDPYFLTEDQIKLLEDHIKGFQMMNKKDESLVDLECVICQSIPGPQNGNLHIFSCQNHHLLCQPCLMRVRLCPVCKQDFRILSAQRNFLAERIALQMHASTPKAELQPQRVLPSELTDTLDDLSAVVRSKVEQLEDKLVKAKSILERVNEFKVSGHYLRSQEVETARENSSKKVEAAIVLHEAIESVKNDRGHLSLEEIKDMTALAENIKSNLSLVI